MGETEFLDNEKILKEKFQKLEELIEESNYIIFYTGAGISTTTGIKDYSGDEGLKKKPKPMVVLGLEENDLEFTKPSFSHFAITHLLQKNEKFKCVVTSNHDK